jgi:hypothetical protein
MVSTQKRPTDYLAIPDLTIADRKAGIARWFELIREPGEWYETRVAKAKSGPKLSVWTNSAETGAELTWQMNANAESVYCGLNPCDDETKDNGADEIVRSPEKTTADVDVTKRLILYFDIDAGQLSGKMATDEERRAAFTMAGEVIDCLKNEFGFIDENLTCPQ